MNIKILKKSTFWVGFLILFVPFVVPIYLPNDSSVRIVIFLVFSLIYYSHCILVEKETERDKAFTREQKENELKKYFASKDKENIERILSFCDIINNFFDNNLKQRIRSNIFLLETNLNSYKIYAQYNMLRYRDYHIAIPKNKGCTGEAWLTKNQVWANRYQIFDGLHRLTLEESQKIDKDLHWVCSTPILQQFAIKSSTK